MATKTLTLEDFQKKIKDTPSFIDTIIDRVDVVDIEHGKLTIYSEHLSKYLEQYACKDEEDLSDTLWYNYGVLVTVID